MTVAIDAYSVQTRAKWRLVCEKRHSNKHLRRIRNAAESAVNQEHPECCVCLEPVESRAVTPCSHPELLCEDYYQKMPSCPLCKAPFENGVPPLEFFDDEFDEGDGRCNFIDPGTNLSLRME